MKVLLIGPTPPPHGGISVHIAGRQRELMAAGYRCETLDPSRYRNKLRFGWNLARYAVGGWSFDVHINGHNWKSWVLAAGCGIVGRLRGGVVVKLTLHSGMAPHFLDSLRGLGRKAVAFASSLYGRVVCVSPAVQDAVHSLGVARDHTEIRPAFLGALRPGPALEPCITDWMQRHRPVLSTVLFFRPEYGFDLLVKALVRLRKMHPAAGCLVMGSGEQRLEAIRAVQMAGLEANVFFAGDVDHDVCLACIARSDLFVRPTLADGDSISVREALALGVPTVASRVGNRPDGTLQFEIGDINDLLAKIEDALANAQVAH